MSKRDFTPKEVTVGEEPLLIGILGPPGSGKTVSSLRLATGIQRARGGRIVVIDTEGGRSKKYHKKKGGDFDFDAVDFEQPFRPEDFLEAINQQVPRKPACIVIDSCSDEHEGPGGYLDWHDKLVAEKKFGDNEWAAWSPPAASRKKLKVGIIHVKIPLIFTFRGRDKTAQVNDDRKPGKKKVVSIGWQPVAPAELVHCLDLTCILPANANGVPIWSTDKAGEELTIKRPRYLIPFVPEGQVNEDMGEKMALYAMGKLLPGADKPEKSEREVLVGKIQVHLMQKYPGNMETMREARRGALIDLGFETASWKAVCDEVPVEKLREVVAKIEEG